MSFRLVVMLAVGCGARANGPLSAPPLMQTVGALTRFDGRNAGTPGERAAADYIVDRMRRIGLAPVEQPFGDGVNVYAIVRGTSDDAVVLGWASRRRWRPSTSIARS